MIPTQPSSIDLARGSYIFEQDLDKASMDRNTRQRETTHAYVFCALSLSPTWWLLRCTWGWVPPLYNHIWANVFQIREFQAYFPLHTTFCKSFLTMFKVHIWYNGGMLVLRSSARLRSTEMTCDKSCCEAEEINLSPPFLSELLIELEEGFHIFPHSCRIPAQSYPAFSV